MLGKNVKELLSSFDRFFIPNSLNNYGMKVYVWYVDSNHISGNPKQVNHAIVEVDFKNGYE